MIFNRYNLFLLFRILLLVGNVLLMIYVGQRGSLWFTFFSLLVAGLIQIYELMWYVNRSHRELTRLITSVRHNDYSVSFVNPKLGKSFSSFYSALNEIIIQLKDSKLEKESQFELFKLMLEKISVGIIALDEGNNMVLINSSARSLLNIPNLISYERFAERRPLFSDAIVELQQYGGRKLVEVFEGGMQKEYSVEVTPLKLKGKTHTLVAFQDIKDEIEQKEIDAWHNLIRILTHEIMNSITPLSSLSETMKSLLVDENNQPIKAEDLDPETTEDLLMAITTINRRSKAMLDFVDDYRRLTRVPAPNFELINVPYLFSGVEELMRSELESKGISFSWTCANKKLSLRCDRKLIEQVLINLLTNAKQALAETEDPTIAFSTSISTENISVHITDNGPGIEREKLSRIFIPFYSTKDQGTGIGLSLSKNIMRTHGGNIQVDSSPEEGTTFTLHFPNHANLM